MKFKPGDIVRFKPEAAICDEFVNAYGRGPFILSRRFSEYTKSWHVFTMDGRRTTLPSGTLEWHTPEHCLMFDTFLDAARKAVTRET
jgi:hypothetical protein